MKESFLGLPKLGKLFDAMYPSTKVLMGTLYHQKGQN